MTQALGPRLRPPWPLLVCSAVVAALIVVEWLHFGAAPAAADAGAPPPSAAPAVAPRLASFDPPPADAFSEIAERPLFIPDRRPQFDAEPARPTPAPVPPSLLVEGVVLAPERHYAVIRHGAPPRLDSVSEGETIDGWTVASIDRSRVTLRAGNATIEFAVGKPGLASQGPHGVRRPQGGDDQ
jgi:general secretion pathway protein N